MTEQQIYEMIQVRYLGYWLEAMPNGFRTKKTGSFTPLLSLTGITLFVLFIFHEKVAARSGETPGWFWWFAGLIILFIIAGVSTSQFRNVIFDLGQKQVIVKIMEMTTFQKPLAEFERFSFDPGYVMNGVDPGGVLYMHFKSGPKMRLLQLRNKEEIQQIQRFILDLLETKSNYQVR